MSEEYNIVKSKIAILGVGAIGSVIAKSLHSNSTNDIQYYNRTPKSEIKIEFESIETIIPIKCESESEISERYDWLIICLKTHQVPKASTLIESLISKNTKVAIIRNGIDLAEDINASIDRGSILPCMIDCPVQPKENGFYWQVQFPVITTERSPLAQTFSDLFRPTQITVNQVNDFKTENWKKLIESSALGSILCLTGQTCHIFNDKQIIKLYEKLIHEGISVAQADGAIIKKDYAKKLIVKVLKHPKSKGSSMLTDRLNGKKIELGAKNGAISRIAKAYKIDTPTNDLFCVLIGKIGSE